MKTLKWFNIVFAACLLISCGAREEEKEETSSSSIQEIFLLEKNGMFRGHSMGESPEKVSSAEGLDTYFNSDTLIEYRTSLAHLNDAEFTLYYAFDNFGLFEIQADLLPDNKEDAEDITEEISEHLNRKYGNPEKLGNIMRWTTNSPSNNLVEISLANETSDFGSPFVSLNYLEPLKNEL